MAGGADGDLALEIDAVARSFGSRRVLRDVSASARAGQTLAVTGPNGSGKSTLMKIVAGLLTPSSGAVRLTRDGRPLDAAARRDTLGYVAPDLTLYGELSGAENLLFFARLRGVALDRQALIVMLERVGLKGRGRDLVSAYSSGMRQRLKYAFALLHAPPILLLDEPTANLDAQGVRMVEEVIAEQKRRGIVVVATNEACEAAWGDAHVQLDAAAATRVRA